MPAFVHDLNPLRGNRVIACAANWPGRRPCGMVEWVAWESDMPKYTAEEVRRELEHRKALRDTEPARCINCGRRLSGVATFESEHGLCEDCLMKDVDE
jgi:hypothetical protein